MNRASPIVTLLGLTLLLGCAQTSKTDAEQGPQSLRVTKTAGGIHHRAELHRAFWLQLVGSNLFVIDPVTAVTVATVPLSETGQWYEAVDMAIIEDRLWVVLNGHSVVEINVANPRKAKRVGRLDQEDLGLRPRHLTKRGSQLWVSGDQGLVRIDETGARGPLQPLEGPSKRIVFVDGRPIACVGRRIVSAEEGSYLGSATQLYRLPGVLDPKRRFLFIREGRQGSLVGVMSESMREVHDAGRVPGSSEQTTSGNGTLIHLGRVHSVRFFDDAIWVVGDGGIDIFRLRGDRLILQTQIAVRGARDIMRISDNYLAVVGTFGRGLYRINTDEVGDGDTFFNVVRIPGGLEEAVSDGRHILAGSDEGYWLYKAAANDAVPWPKPKGALPGPLREAVLNETRLDLAADGQTATLSDAERQYVWSAPPGTTLNTVAAVEGQFWIGHDQGIVVFDVVDLEETTEPDAKAVQAQGLSPNAASFALVERESIDLPGPILALQPLLSGRGVAYASRAGFGTVEWGDAIAQR